MIPILYDFQKEYKKPDNPHLAVILDCYRRIVDKSLQGTQNSSMTTIAKLEEQFEKTPYEKCQGSSIFLPEGIMLWDLRKIEMECITKLEMLI